MHERWTIPTTIMMYTRSQTYTIVVVDECGMQTCEIVIVMLLLLLLSFDVFVPTSVHTFPFMTKWFVQIYLNVSSLCWLWGSYKNLKS